MASLCSDAQWNIYIYRCMCLSIYLSICKSVWVRSIGETHEGVLDLSRGPRARQVVSNGTVPVTGWAGHALLSVGAAPFQSAVVLAASLNIDLECSYCL